MTIIVAGVLETEHLLFLFSFYTIRNKKMTVNIE